MNSKKVNWFFLTAILLHILIVVSMVVFSSVFSLGMIANFIVSSALFLVPALLFLAFSGENWKELLGFYRIKWSTAGMVVLFTFLTMPLITLINAFTMLFVENAVAGIEDQVMELPFLVSFFFMAVNAPVCEEIVFRGMAYRGYRRSGTLLQAAVLSAVLFALGHMNFNQAAYAFVIGIVLVLLVEAAGSIWASIIYHVVFNGYSVCLMYFMDWVVPEGIEIGSPGKEEYMDSLLYGMGVSMVAASVTVGIAACVLIWIAKNEGRSQRLKEIWTTRHDKKERMITIPFIIAIVLSFAFMIAEVILYRMVS